MKEDADGGESFLRIILDAVHFGQLTPPEQRVLGALIEKRWTTPDQYPLSLNGLRLACNQSTNRDPVTQYDEQTVRDAAQRLSRYGLARLASGHNSRATKYRHLAEEALGLGREELAVLAVLLLRGPQTPGELKARTERMAAIASLEQLEEIMTALAEHGYARRVPRRPGQKEDRFEHLLGGAPEDGSGSDSADELHPAPPLERAEPPAVPRPAFSPPRPAPERDDGLAHRVDVLERQVAVLRRQLEALGSELGVSLEDELADEQTLA